jgi:copper homeostasis protein (lipoprotein)
MKKLFMLMAAPVLLAACQSDVRPAMQAPADTLAADSTATVRAVYTGTLPCADCAGILTRLTLYTDMTYAVKETYQGKGRPNTTEAKGSFNEEKGFEDDADAAVIVLNYGKPGQERYFLRLTARPGELQMLDKSRQQIKSTLNYTLKEQ